MDVKLGAHTDGRRPGGRVAAAACAIAGAGLFQFYGNHTAGYIKSPSLFYWWGVQWTANGSESGHGWLILGIAAWLWWRAAGKPEAADRKPERIWPAFAALLAGLVLHALGFAAQQARVSIVALLVFTWGVLRLGGGARWGRAAVFPLAFLVFAIPFDGLDSIGFWLRVWVVKAGAALAHAAGIGVLQSGTQLVAPDGAYNYDVAAACSGIRSLTAMAALALLAGYLNFRSWARRAGVLLLALPLVYLGNVARICAIIFAAQVGGPRWGDVAHEVMGYGVFVIVLGGVLLAIAALRRWRPEENAPEGGGRRAERPNPPSALRSPRVAALVPILVVVIAIAEMFFLRHLASLPARGGAGVALAADGLNPVELPAFLGTDWIGRRAEVTAVERGILPADTGFSRKNYVALADPRQSVFLSIVLSGRDRTSIHRPELCLVGQGWTIADAAVSRFRYPGADGGSFPATLLRTRREVQAARGKQIVPQLVAYWFVNADAVVATHWQRLLRDAVNRVVHGRADRWAYVLMQTDAADGEAAALARMQAVLDATLPVFQRPVPGAKSGAPGSKFPARNLGP